MCCRARTCCGCCGLDIGAYVVGAFTIIICALEIAGFAYSLNALVAVGLNFSNASAYMGPLVAYLVFFCLWLLSAILLIVGASQRKRGMLIPWMVITIIVLVLYGIGILALIIVAALWATMGAAIAQSLSGQTNYLGYNTSAIETLAATYFIVIIVILVIVLLMFALWIYATVVICSLHSEIRDEELGGGQQQFQMQQGAPAPGYNQGAYNQGYQPQQYAKDPYQRV